MHKDSTATTEISSDFRNLEQLDRDTAEILARTTGLVPTGSPTPTASHTSGNTTGTVAAPMTTSMTGQPSWQTAIKRAVRSTAELRRAVALPIDPWGSDEPDFPCFVPWEYIARMQPGNPHDPLLRQVLPQGAETRAQGGFTADPVGDLAALAAGGVLHKYAGRALIIASGVCGVHCRYCFRREFPYADAGSRVENWRPAIDYIANQPAIDEVILSGGDPLTLSDQKLGELITALEQIPHLRRLRIHTRLPIVIPQRVTPWLVERLSHSSLTAWLVVHVNHPHELDSFVLKSLAMFISAGVPVLNQAVLLRGVNDCADTLIDLCRRLVDHRIQPYYLHQLDRVRGAAHFEVPIAEGQRIMTQLRAALPGYAVPNYVIERAGEPNKTPIFGESS
jgi:EF-P beta-lysylation protein EpmB